MPGEGAVILRAMSIFPTRLRAGDRVAIFATAGTGRWSIEPTKLGMKFLEHFGLKPELGASVTTPNPSYSCRSRQERADDVMAQIRNPDVRALFGLIGGSTTAEILPLLDFSDFKRDPKVIMGSSDIAALLLAANAQADLVTYLGENVMWGLSKQRQSTFANFERAFIKPEVGPLPDEGERVAWAPGRVSGKLIASNLYTLRGLIGTPYLPSFDGTILAWEELHEDLEDLGHMLNHLRIAGHLGKLKGMAVGHLEGIEQEERGLSQDAFVRFALEGNTGPVLKMTEFGHFRSSAIMPIGIQATLDADAKQLVFDEPSVR
jgi:muramoyltetrapeptide carboxypeptidase